MRLKAHIVQNGEAEKMYAYIALLWTFFLTKMPYQPGACVLLVEPVPDELKSLDALSKQLIQRANWVFSSDNSEVGSKVPASIQCTASM